MAAAAEDTFSGRLGGLFRAKSNVGSKQEQELHALQAELQESNAAEKKSREHIQQLELEKVLLQNFVDQVMGSDDGGDEGDSNSAAEVKTQISTLTSKNAELTIALEKTRQEREELDSKLHQTERKCAAFERALNNVQDELREGDVKLRHTADQLSEQQTQDQIIQRLTDELESKTNTLEELMGRVSKIDDEKKQSESDFTAILQKTQQAQQTTMTELEESRQLGKTLSARVAELEKEKGDLVAAPAAPQVEESLMNERIAELEAKAEKELAELKEQLEEAEKTLAEREETLTSSNTALEDDKAKLSSALEETKDDLDHLQAMLMKKEGDLNSTETALQDAEARGQAAMDEAATKHDALAEKVTDAEKALEASAAVIEAKDGTIAELREEVDGKAALEEELEALQEGLRTREEQIQELETRVMELENEGKVGQRKSANLVKELQQQVLKLQRSAHMDPNNGEGSAQTSPTVPRVPALSIPTSANMSKGATPEAVMSPTTDGNSTAVTNSVLEEENAQLIGRVASLQQEVWVLTEAKKSYEGEMVRLNDQLGEKDVIITAHFYDMAQKYNKDKGKFGATFFKASQEEVHARLQASLEEALTDNIRVQNELREQGKSLTRAMRVVELAEEQGLVQQDSDMEDSLDDSYDGTFE